MTTFCDACGRAVRIDEPRFIGPNDTRVCEACHGPEDTPPPALRRNSAGEIGLVVVLVAIALYVLLGGRL